MQAVQESPLHAALLSGDHLMFRRRALELLGISSAHVDGDESGADASDVDSNSEGSTGPSISSSSSEEGADDIVETCTDVPVPPPPPPSVEDTSCLRRVKGQIKFCSAFQSRCGGDHSAAAEVPQPPVSLRKSTQDEDGDESTVASSEDFSDISDDTDIFHLTVDPHKTWCTEQDQDQERICFVASLLRRNPLLPPDPADPSGETDWCDVQSGVALPRAHCGFKGCMWVNDSKDDWENLLKQHVRARHLQSMQLSERDRLDF